MLIPKLVWCFIISNKIPAYLHAVEHLMLVLIQGEWRKKFRSNETGTFYLSQDETVNAQYMADTFDVKFMYDATNELDFVELPYVSLKGGSTYGSHHIERKPLFSCPGLIRS